MKRIALIMFFIFLLSVFSFARAATQSADGTSMVSSAKVLKNAVNDDLDALYELGMKYYFGNGVPKNFKKAFELYTKAALQGHVDAQFDLGQFYMFGNGVPKDSRKAYAWFRMAAMQDHSNAQFNLGYMFLAGDGVSRDIAKSYALLKLAVTNEDPDAFVKAEKTLASISKAMSDDDIKQAQELYNYFLKTIENNKKRENYKKPWWQRHQR